MRGLRVLLALLLTAGPIQAQPVVDLLSRYTVPADEAAASAPEGDAPQGSGQRLAALESDLALVSESLEGFAHPQDAAKALLSAKPRLPAGTAPFFRDRAAALDALYRTLAVVDYTWALRFPDAPCSPAAKRAALLRSDDGLFLDPISGNTSAWMTALLGPNASGNSLESALDQASASAGSSQAGYARLRARQNLITKALAAEDAVGEARAKLYCKRAETRVKLAAANRVSGPVLAARSSEEKVSRQGLVILAGKTAEGLEARGAGIVVDTKSGIRVLTDRRLGSGEVVALIDGSTVPVSLSVEREDENSGLLLLRPDGDLGETLTWADASPKKDDLVFALAHSERLGAWTKTQGLVTLAGPDQFQTDAVADASMTGGAVLDEEGRIAGLLVLRRAEGTTIDWPTGVPAPALRAWLEGGAAPAASPVAPTNEGTTQILTASRPLLQSVAVGEGATSAGYGFDTQTQWGSVHATCMANCGDSSPRSSYSDNGSAELGQALGKLAAIGAEALIFRGIPALFRGIGSLFKSKPRASPSTPSHEIAQTRPREIQKSEEPPKITGTKLALSASEALEGESVSATVSVIFSHDNPRMKGIEVTLSTEGKGKVLFPFGNSAVTNASGQAAIVFEIGAADHDREQPFNELKQEERHRAGEESISQVRPQRKAKNEFDQVKAKMSDRFQSLDDEETRTERTEAPSDRESIPETVPDSLIQAAMLTAPTPAAMAVLYSLKLTARAVPNGRLVALGAKLHDENKVEIQSGICPAGSIAAFALKPDDFSPGEAARPDIVESVDRSDCLKLQRLAREKCQTDIVACINNRLSESGYYAKGCAEFENPDEQRGKPSPASPPSPNLQRPKARSPIVCLPQSSTSNDTSAGKNGAYRSEDKKTLSPEGQAKRECSKK